MPPAKKSTRKKAVEGELELELEDLELEDDGWRRLAFEDDEPAPKRKKKGAKAKTSTKASAKAEVTFGAAELAELISEETGEEMTARALRMLLRRLAKKGAITRDEEEGRTRYSWTGPSDPEVKVILKAVKSGELKAERAEKLAELKKKPRKKKARSK